MGLFAVWNISPPDLIVYVGLMCVCWWRVKPWFIGLSKFLSSTLFDSYNLGLAAKTSKWLYLFMCWRVGQENCLIYETSYLRLFLITSPLKVSWSSKYFLDSLFSFYPLKSPLSLKNSCSLPSLKCPVLFSMSVVHCISFLL